MKKEEANTSVCFFDSGIGGINLLYECVRKLPRVDFTYFADNYRMPYGNLSHEQLIETADAVFDRINSVNPAAAVIACNTVTAHCIDYLRQKYRFPIVGIQPAIKPAVGNGDCLVLATPATVESGSLKILAEKYGGGRTRIIACHELASYIEKNIFNLTYEDIIRFLPKIKAGSVVLGCTHYIFVKDIIKRFYGYPVFDGIEGTADRLCKILGNFDHQLPRAQKIAFEGGDKQKNRAVFNFLLSSGMGANP